MDFPEARTEVPRGTAGREHQDRMKQSRCQNREALPALVSSFPHVKIGGEFCPVTE